MSETIDPLNLSVSQFIDATAAKTPTPGGGSVAGVVASLAAALGEMSVHFTRGKKQFAQYEQVYQAVTHHLQLARQMFQQLTREDMEAYNLYQQASKDSGGDSDCDAVQLALSAATNVPRELAKLSLAVLENLSQVTDKCNRWLVSDLLAGAALAETAVRLSYFNVLVNTPQLTDRQAAADMVAGAKNDVQRACAMLAEINAKAGDFLK